MKNYIKYYLLIIVMGFFAIIAQTLIFRRFLVSFEGNELSVGLFFFSWLIWICIGAVFAKNKYIQRISGYFHWLIIIYIPIFILQFLCLFFINSFFGGNFYEAVSINEIAVCTVLLNAPVSFVTGFIFVTASDWINNCTEKTVPVITVYMLEALGSFLGALFVTVLLFISCSEVLIFLLTSIVLMLIVTYFSYSLKSKISELFCIITLLIFVLAAFSPLSGYIQRMEFKKQWSNLIKGGRFTGAFSTHQSEYVYGKYNNDFIVISSNSIYDSFPNLDSTRAEAVEYLSQKPNAQNILVIGTGGYSLSSVLAGLSQVKKIYWLDSDPGYSRKITGILPENFDRQETKLNVVSEDIRYFINSEKQKFDLVILHLPAPSNLLQNRYFTKEFFCKLKNIINENGVIGVSFPGGDNYLGPELTFLGSSIYVTLKSVFPDIILKPGLSSIFFVANAKGILSESGRYLELRLNEVKGIKSIYLPGQIRSSYEKNRIDFQLSSYNKLIKSTPIKYLINSDENPKSFLYTLLFTIKRYSALQFDYNQIKNLLYMVFPLCVFILVLYFIFRIIYHKLFTLEKLGYLKDSKSKIKKNISMKLHGACRHDIYLLVFAAAVIGMGLNLILLFLFQINYGTLFLCFGLVTAFFMFGMSINAWLIDKLLQHYKGEFLLFLFSFLFIVFISLILFQPPVNSLFYFGVLFFLSGFFCGTYFPLAGYLLKTGKKDKDYHAASVLEVVDNLGGAVSSILFSIILIPVAGLSNSLILFIVLLVIVNIHSLLLKERHHSVSTKKEDYGGKLDKLFKLIGSCLLVLLIIYLFLLIYVPANQKTMTEKPIVFPKDLVNELIGEGAELKQHSIVLDGEKLYYLTVYENDKLAGYIFKTQDYTDYERGYAGPINMLSYVGQGGKIKNFTVVNSNETPAYLKSVLNQKKIFLGENSFGAYEDYEINAVTGATITSKAISETLYRAGKNFISLRTGNSIPTIQSGSTIHYKNLSVLFLVICLVMIALSLNFAKKMKYKKRLRLFFLLSVFIFLGIYLNIQYSTDQVLSLISGKINFENFNLFTILCIGIPVLIILFGNIYCGYLCPFGALQEIIYDAGGFFRRKLHLNKRIQKTVWVICRSFKYIILTSIIFIFLYTKNKSTAGNTDLLLQFFTLNMNNLLIWSSVIYLILSIFYNRFWCRILCPSGAFLSLFNGLHKFIFRESGIVPGNCDIGVQNKYDLDCISCNRCFRKTKNKKTGMVASVLLFVLSVLLLLVFVFLISNSLKENKTIALNINAGKEKVIKELSGMPIKAQKTKRQTKRTQQRRRIKYTKPSKPIPSLGKSRKIDKRLYQQYIDKNYLSDKEAMYYRKIKN